MTARRTGRRLTALALLLAGATSVAAVGAGGALADGRGRSEATTTGVGVRMQETAKNRKVPEPLPATPPAPPAPTNPTVDGVPVSSFDQALIADVNAARAAKGVAPLTVRAGTQDLGRTWSTALAAGGVLKHNPDFVKQLPSFGSPDWTVCGENVGYAGDEKTLFNAYMASDHHRDNILDARFTVVGIATVVDASGRAWNTMDFTNQYASSYGSPRTTP